MNPKFDGYQRRLAGMAYKFFDKKTRSEQSVNKGLAEELYKLMKKKMKRRKVYARIKAAVLAEMRSLSSFN